MSELSIAIARLRQGTEILRTAGGIRLSAIDCHALLEVLDVSAWEQLYAAAARAEEELA